MLRTSIARSAGPMAAWMVIHSLLQSFAAKRLARSLFGRRYTEGLYRLAFNAFAVVTFLPLLRYIWSLPDQPLYRVGGLARRLMFAAQAVVLLLTLDAARRVGWGLITGIRQSWQLARGEEISPTPVAQNPYPRGPDLGWTGEFRFTRQPLNYLVLVAFWLTPTMTRKWASLGALATVYMVLGSTHSNHRLLVAYGDRYRRYSEQAPHFLLPVGRWLSRL